MILELGKYIVGSAGYYVTEIVDIKDCKGQKHIVCAGGVKIRKMRFVPTTVHNVDVGGQKKDILSVIV